LILRGEKSGSTHRAPWKTLGGGGIIKITASTVGTPEQKGLCGWKSKCNFRGGQKQGVGGFGGGCYGQAHIEEEKNSTIQSCKVRSGVAGIIIELQPTKYLFFAPGPLLPLVEFLGGWGFTG